MVCRSAQSTDVVSSASSESCPLCRKINWIRFISGTVATTCVILLLTSAHYNSDYRFVLVGEGKYQGAERRHDDCVKRAKRTLSIQCKWPPDDPEDLRDSVSGVISLAINPIVIIDEKTGYHAARYIRRAFSQSERYLIRGSWLRRLVLLDSIAKRSYVNPNHKLYPQLVDMPKIVRAIRNGIPVNEYPTNDIPLEVLARPRAVCRIPDNRVFHDLIVVIKTCTGCFENRKLIRQSFDRRYLWGNFKVTYAFVTGLPQTDLRSTFTFHGVDVPAYVPNSEYNPEREKRDLFEESRKHKDLLIGSFLDSYYNLTKKLIFSFRWVAAFCRKQAPLYLFIDDDEVIIPHNLIKIIRRIPRSSRTKYSGGIRFLQRPVRPSIFLSDYSRRWAVSEDEMPWSNYPPYLHGTSYILGWRNVIDLSIAMAYTKEYRIDDVYLGFVMQKLRMKITPIPEMIYTVTAETDIAKIATLSRSDATTVLKWPANNSVKIE